jgi:hypothetical protein
MDENIRKKVAGGERLGDPPRVSAAALGQLARVIVAPDGGLSLGVTNEKQSAHEGRLRKRSRIGKLLSSTANRRFRAAPSGDFA